jgi:hypothetical protein
LTPKKKKLQQEGELFDPQSDPEPLYEWDLPL